MKSSKGTKTDNSYVLNYNLNDNYPLIPNQNTYFEQEKILCINSSDRNIIKYPQSNSFEIFLPTDIVNVSSIQLNNWTFPSEIHTFSYKRNNLQMEFTIDIFNHDTVKESIFYPFGGTGNTLDNEYVKIVNDVLKISNNFIITINEGTYGNTSLAYEVQNQMNAVVDNAIIEYMKSNHLGGEFYTPYVFFNVIISGSENKFWFVNTLNSFKFLDSELYKTNNLIGEVFNPCLNDKVFSSYTYYGLPAYLGFKDIPAFSTVCKNKYDLINMTLSYPSLPEPSFQQNIINGEYVNVNYIKPLFNYTLAKDMYIYLEIEVLNCGDETKPFSNNEFTKITNQGNGSVNSFLGRIPLFTISSMMYASSNGGSDKQPTSYFNPPLEKLRKLKINLRYHDGTNVDFGLNEWDFALNITSFLPTQNKKITKTPF